MWLAQGRVYQPQVQCTINEEESHRIKSSTMNLLVTTHLGSSLVRTVCKRICSPQLPVSSTALSISGES